MRLASTLPGNPRRLFSCTPSRLAAFDCRRHYRFAYLDRPGPRRGRQWAHSTVGAGVHLALARWWLRPLAERTAAEGGGCSSRTGTPTASAIRSMPRDGAASPARGWRAICATSTPRSSRSGSSAPSRPPRTSSRSAAGSIELTTGATNSSSSTTRPGAARPPSRTRADRRRSRCMSSRCAARFAARAVGSSCTTCRQGRWPPSSTATPSLARHVSRAEATVRDIVAATDALASGAADVDDVFPPRPSTSCSWCDFRAVCPEGRAASSELEPWAGLDDDD